MVLECLMGLITLYISMFSGPFLFSFSFILSTHNILVVSLLLFFLCPATSNIPFSEQSSIPFSFLCKKCIWHPRCQIGIKTIHSIIWPLLFLFLIFVVYCILYSILL